MTEPAPSEPGAATSSLYDQVGGAPAVTEAVERFYKRVLDDPQLADFFAGVDLAGLKHHQTLLLSQVLGGPEQYEGRTLAQAHAGLGITENDYTRVGGHLIGVLEELGAGANVIEAVGSTLAAVRGDIVTGGAPASAG